MVRHDFNMLTSLEQSFYTKLAALNNIYNLFLGSVQIWAAS